ncbi:MAG: hypothetical protein ISS15_06015 [Alphaproteobacteria bacterium]|nr:hypothetical protein [Alphaproteobacteria bacterium]MBL6939324.1 hypothetical protein [Alphaproteobacteria bacterium]MBL7097195.1 hypothetical protein [Alphaproteobacteria bacterium]
MPQLATKDISEPRYAPLRSAADIAALWPGRRAAFVAAHPGHELAVLGWLTAARPLVHVLTDGSGHVGKGRADVTAELVTSLGARIAAPFAPMSDAAIYRAMMDGDTALFCGLLDTLVESLAANGIDLVVGDAREGFNPAHDICRALIDRAAAMTADRLGRDVLNYSVRLTDWDLAVKAPHDDACVHLELSGALFEAKLAAACAYRALGDEVARALSTGADQFRTECLSLASEPVTEPPHYETVGRERVRQGFYREALLYRAHVVPVLAALDAHRR